MPSLPGGLRLTGGNRIIYNSEKTPAGILARILAGVFYAGNMGTGKHGDRDVVLDNRCRE